MLKKRCERFLRELSVPTAAFCRKINISTTAYYNWRAGLLNLSDATLQRIDDYLTKYNF